MKTWYTSKTLWVNAIAALALIVQSRYGFVIDAEIQAAILTIINLILRISTRQEINWNKSAPGSDDTDGGPGIGPVVPCLFFLVLLSGCATTGPAVPGAVDTVVLSGKSLVATQRTIVALAVQADALCDQGVIKPEDCGKIAAAYALAKPAYDAAADALLLAMHSDTAGSATTYADRQAAFNRLAQDVIRLAAQVGITTGGAP